MATKRKLTDKSRQRMGYGRVKGASFERQTCNDIVKTFRVSPQDCYRSTQSGAHKDSYGDISVSTALAKRFNYAPECKFYSKIDLNVLLTPWKKMTNACWFRKWWEQTLRGSEKCGRTPLLVFKANGKQVLCAIPYPKYRTSISQARLEEDLKSIPHFVVLIPDAKIREQRKIWIGSWDEFLSSAYKARIGEKK